MQTRKITGETQFPRQETMKIYFNGYLYKLTNRQTYPETTLKLPGTIDESKAFIDRFKTLLYNKHI